MISGLAWLGRHGSVMLAFGVFLGLLPPLAALFKPLLIPGIVLPFLIALLRLDWQPIKGHLGNPTIILALIWLLVAAPMAVDALLGFLPLTPGLHHHLVLLAAAAPLMASASIALIIGLDASLALALTMLATALAPFTLPPIALYLLHVDINIGMEALMVRLGVLIGGSFLLAWLIRRYLPEGFTERHAAPLDGLAVLGLLIFAIAIMDGVTIAFVERPIFVLTTAMLVLVLNLGMQALGALLFAWQGLKMALSIGLCSGSRNVGIVVAALADRASVDLLILVALAQLPIYILPVLQRWLYRRWLKVASATKAPGGR